MSLLIVLFVSGLLTTMASNILETKDEEPIDTDVSIEYLCGEIPTITKLGENPYPRWKKLASGDQCADNDCSDCESACAATATTKTLQQKQQKKLQRRNNIQQQQFDEQKKRYKGLIDDDIVPEKWGFNYKLCTKSHREKCYIPLLTRQKINRFITLGNASRKHIYSKGLQLLKKNQWKLLKYTCTDSIMTMAFQIKSNGTMKICEFDIRKQSAKYGLKSSNDITDARCTCFSPSLCYHICCGLLAVADNDYEIPFVKKRLKCNIFC